MKLVMIGHGMVGHKFIDNLVNHADAANYQVITFSEEPRLAYDRVQLSKYFSGSTAEDLMLTSEDYYNEKSVEFILKDKVVDLDLENKEVITLRGTVIPLIRLTEVLDVESTRSAEDNLIVVIVKKGDKMAGLVIDELIGQQEIVIKSLGKYIKQCKFISGATILGDGEVALILDANALL
jgi:hypothetical protein